MAAGRAQRVPWSCRSQSAARSLQASSLPRPSRRRVPAVNVLEERFVYMAAPWDKSETWRWLVRKTRDSKPFFYSFAVLCGVVPTVVGLGVMAFTNSRNEQLEAQLRKNARPESLKMGQVNRERLAEYLGELQRKEDTNDRYVAALKGETLTRKPYVRIQSVPKANDNANETVQIIDNKQV